MIIKHLHILFLFHNRLTLKLSSQILNLNVLTGTIKINTQVKIPQIALFLCCRHNHIRPLLQVQIQLNIPVMTQTWGLVHQILKIKVLQQLTSRRPLKNTQIQSEIALFIRKAFFPLR